MPSEPLGEAEGNLLLNVPQDQSRHISESPTTLNDDWSWVVPDGGDVTSDTTHLAGRIPLISPDILVDEPIHNPTENRNTDLMDSHIIDDEPRMDSTQMSTLADLARRYSDRCTKLQPRQKELLLLRDRVMYAQTTYTTRLRFVRESQKALMQEIGNLVAARSFDPEFATVSLFYQKSLEDEQALQEQTTTLFGLGDELDVLQSSVMKRESALAKTATAILTTLQDADIVDVTEPRSRDPRSTARSDSSHGISTESVQPELADYFDKVGTFKIMREAFGDVHVEYNETRALRMLQADQEQTLSISDEEFYSTFARESHEAEVAMDLARDEMKAAKAICLDLGINPDDYVPPVSEDDEGQIEVIPIAESPQIPDTPSSIGHGLPPPIIRPSFPLSEIHERNESLEMLAAANGTPHVEETPRRRKRDKVIEDWIYQVDPHYNDSDHDQHNEHDDLDQSREDLSDRQRPFEDLPFLYSIENANGHQHQPHVEDYMHISSQLLRGVQGSQFLQLPSLGRRGSESDLSSLRSRRDSHQDVLKDLTSRPP